MSKRTEDNKAYAIEKLNRLIPKGSMVYTAVTKVARDGMSRNIKVLAAINDTNGPRIVNISAPISDLIEYFKWSDDGSVKVGGAGMDMGFHVVYEVASALYGDGYALSHSWI